MLINKYTNQGYIPYIMQYVSNTFSVTNVFIYYLIAFISVLVYFKKFSTQHFWFLYNYLAKIAIIYGFILVIYTLLKHTVNMPRPFCSLSPNEFKTIADVCAIRCLSSFPSAHTGLTIFISYTLWPWLKKYQKILAISIVILLGISRITAAMHFPADILYSIPLVFLCIFLGNLIYKLCKNNIIKKIGILILHFLN